MKPHFIALLTFAAAKKNVKATPVSSGYRAFLKFPYEKELITGRQNFIDSDLVFPGDVVSSEITLFGSASLEIKLYEGLDFEFFESENLIGEGTITKLL